MKFSSKANTLINLKKKIKFSKIFNLIKFKFYNFKKIQKKSLNL